LVIIPRVPSDPTKRLVRLYPAEVFLITSKIRDLVSANL
jgi:hypothetical protein